MLHFSCDLCGRGLNEQRYVVRLEVYPAFDPEDIGEDDLEPDHLQHIAEVIEEYENSGDPQLEDQSAKSFRYDLCPHCYHKFLRDPLGRDAKRRVNFSEN